jgi:inner membrane protein
MDSITQIVLGAACGEIVLGKKIGAKAALLGAIGGTIPDLDVLGRMFMGEIDALAFHRGFMHSFLFAFLAPWPLAWLCTKWGWLNKHFRPSFKAWWLLWFWSIFTHPILDCFTNYGTQIFRPFSDVRVAWSTISIVDPLYTLPFAALVIWALRSEWMSKKRFILGWTAIFVSSSYLLFTVYHKMEFNKIFVSSLNNEGSKPIRYMSNPTIFNNTLWYGVGEEKDSFVMGLYSFNDKQKKLSNIIRIPKNHSILAEHQNDREIKILKWFSNNYYAVSECNNEKRYFDMRFGLIDWDQAPGCKGGVFFFALNEKNGELLATQKRDNNVKMSDALKKLWARKAGI